MKHQPNESAARESSRVALITCAELPDLDSDDRLLLPLLAARRILADAVVWDDPGTDWAAYDLAVLRSTWDYAARRDEFVAWAASVPALANPADVVVWNTDKRYLAELAAAGVPVVPTAWVAPRDRWNPPDSGEHVVKPAVSVGGKDTGRYDLTDPQHRERAAAHVARLQAAGRLVMVQPYLATVDTYGETALHFLSDGAGGAPAYSHATRKGPLLIGPDEGVAGLYREEDIAPRTPTAAELAVAGQTLAALPARFAGSLLYARVDLLHRADGAPLLVELELTEPSLNLGTAAGSADRFATAIAARAAAAREARRPQRQP